MLSRRQFIVGVSAGISSTVACRRGPLVQTRLPEITHGVQSGDVQSGRALVWARCSEPARMLVEWDTTDRFTAPRRVSGPVVGPDGDLAGIAALDGLPDAQTVAYRVRFERVADRGASAWAQGKLTTPRADGFRVAWTADTCGQGYGRNPAWGGLRGYAAIRDAAPAFFLHSGDMMYADNPIVAELPLPDGRIWRNTTNERVARVAQSLADFRARYAYNLEDDHVRALARDVPIIAQWDDHEVRNNWWPGQELADPRYTEERRASVLAARARQAMREWNPTPAGPVHRVLHYGPLLDVIVLDCRSFRTRNDANRGEAGAMLGTDQARWFVDAVTGSRARWKLIACDQPIGLVIEDGPDQEGFANGDGPPLGRERELAGILAALRDRGARNLVWVTGDVHYAAAHHYDPGRATGAVFEPFWEFIAGPIHAGSFGPNTVDPTFGPEVKFQWAPPPGQANLAPWDGLQSFGTIDVSRDALAVAIMGIDGQARYRVELPYV